VTFYLPRIYPITDTSISGLTHAEQVKRLLDGGASLIQLREKRAAPCSFFNDAAAALRIARAAGATLIINDRVDIALALRADGVHLGQSDLPVDTARRLLGHQAIIGFSTHNTGQAKAALGLPIDYLAFGPIYTTTTKENPDPVAGLRELGKVKALTRSFPLVAIGGINLSNAPPVLAAGADGLAVISGVLLPPSEMAQNFRNLRNLADKTSAEPTR